MADAAPRASIALVVLLIGATAGAWQWQQSVFRARRPEVKSEPWERIKESYPLNDALAAAPALSPEIVEAVVRANPFSSQRRFVPPPDGSGQGPNGAPPKPPPPKFTFKGRINLGTRQRAIVEEMTTHKTYFLEVGQEVAGFKVLDIAENQVVLSDTKTQKEEVVSLSSQAPPSE